MQEGQQERKMANNHFLDKSAILFACYLYREGTLKVLHFVFCSITLLKILQLAFSVSTHIAKQQNMCGSVG